MNTWNDISTAPRDGENVLGWDGELIQVVWYNDVPELFVNLAGKGVNPTHWMPLPTPPDSPLDKPQAVG